MTRKVVTRLAAAAVSVAAIVAALTAVAGTGFAAPSTAAQATYTPTNTAAPTISGTPQVGQTLTASQGSWTSDTTATYGYQWQRCDAQGNNCAAISGATAQTYAVQSADLGKTLRVTVTATNSSGSSAANSAQTAVVTQANSNTTQGSTVAASSVVLPDRLLINSVKFTPGRLTSRRTFTGRFHVTNSTGHPVSEALVLVTVLPYSWGHTTSGEVRTDQTGWATIKITPTRNMPLGKRASLVMFVRARVEGQPLLGGSSVRRLVQVTVR
ncbi:MAG TPA: hypothetical protein VFA30_04795 [Gaiellaceae bacterium]|nr:hypothetical protein [Gaiellaceae bacterium]